MSSVEHRYRSGGSPRPAFAILAIALLLTLLLPAADLRLLAFLFVLPPLVWLGLEWRRQATCLVLDTDSLHLGRPLRPRPLTIAYGRVSGLAPWGPDRIGLVYAVPRPPFEGEPDPRPPRLRVAISAPLADRAAALADLTARVADVPRADPCSPALPDDHILAHLRRHRWRQRGLIAALILASPLVTIAIFRLGFELARSLRIGG
jgi:hypothetical protein